MDSLTWTSHPAKIRPKATILVIAFILVMFFIVYAISQSFYMILLAALIFTVSLSTFFFPTRYEINKDQVRVKYMFKYISYDLKRFRTYYPDKNGILLSPFTRPSRLENFRGLYVRYHQNKQEVDDLVKAMFEERQNEP